MWDASVDRHITGDLLIPEGSTLTIEHGTRVLLGDKVNLRIEGQIFTRGTADDPIVFNSIDRGQPWGGVELIDATGNLQYTFITNGGADTGHMTAEGNVLYENGDNVRNFDGSIPGPKPGAMDIIHSLTNDEDFDGKSGNTAGIPRFGPLMHRLRDSAGFRDGDQDAIIGRLPAAANATFTVTAAAPTVTIVEIGRPRVAPVDEIVIQFDQPMSNVDVSDITLSRNGGDDLLSGTDVELVTADQTTFRLAGIGPRGRRAISTAMDGSRPLT